MIHPLIRHAACCPLFLSSLLLTLSLFFTASIALAVATGDQVGIEAAHQAGVPFHNAHGGSPQFQRVPGGTVATVLGIDRGCQGPVCPNPFVK